MFESYIFLYAFLHRSICFQINIVHLDFANPLFYRASAPSKLSMLLLIALELENQLVTLHST